MVDNVIINDNMIYYLGLMDLEDPLMSPTQESEVKPTKREGNGHSEQTVPTHAKTSRRTTSLLNLFMSNSQGTC